MNTDWLIEVTKFLEAYSKVRVLSCCRSAMNWEEGWRDLYINRFEQVSAPLQDNWQRCHRERLQAPESGDIVEVCWSGKFNGSIGNGETCSVDHGASWWTALVVGRTPEGLYKVTFPGWSPVWDELIHRHQCRWPTQLQHPRLRERRKTHFSQHDFVEICFWPDAWPADTTTRNGLSLQLRRPPVWLEASVLKVKTNKDNETYIKVLPTLGGMTLFGVPADLSSLDPEADPPKPKKKVPKNKPFWVKSTKVVLARPDPIYNTYQFKGDYKHVFLTLNRKGNIVQYSPPTQKQQMRFLDEYDLHQKFHTHHSIKSASRHRSRRALALMLRRLRHTIENKKHQACASLVPVSSTTPF